MTGPARARARRTVRRRDEAGYAAVVTALLASVVFMGMAAFGVDTARWYMEIERVQKAADAAALAGVTYMPHDLPSARTTAIASATRNGYPNSGTSSVTVVQGDKPSELKVTITSTIDNTFGGMLGFSKANITRSAVADYTAPAPMGSPCNTFANEPPSQPVPAPQPAGTSLPSGTAADGTPLPFPNCTSQPDFWAAIQGPNTDKEQGDRFMDYVCDGGAVAGSTYECSGGRNSEFREDGYYWAVHVEPQAVGTSISVQVYDPAFIFTQINCASAYQTYSLVNNMNDFTTTDGATRYARTSGTGGTAAARIYCPGDYNPGGRDDAATGTTDHPPTTTFVLRHQNDTFNPKAATPIAGCNKQFVGMSNPPSISQLTKGTTSSSAYDYQMSQVFHQWYEICSFTPTAPGDYYLQVRTDVSTAGGSPIANPKPGGGTRTSLIYQNNPNAVLLNGGTARTMVGTGLNAFSLRAVPSDSSKKQYIAMAGNESMPILQNKDGSTATFNLIKALPGTRGQYIAFDFYDPADGAGTTGATVKILPPPDSTGSVKSGVGGTPPDCKHAKNKGAYTTATNCTVTVKNSTHDGQVEHIVIPIPNDYNCTATNLGGCWFSVQIQFPGSVTDFTTWTANIGGDPVRLIE